jgi:hypothetical protein
MELSNLNKECNATSLTLVERASAVISRVFSHIYGRMVRTTYQIDPSDPVNGDRYQRIVRILTNVQREMTKVQELLQLMVFLPVCKESRETAETNPSIKLQPQSGILDGIMEKMIPPELEADLFDKIGGIGELALLGAMMDSPNDPRPAGPMLRKPLPAMCNSKGISYATRLTLDPATQNLCEPHHFGTTQDEMEADYVFKLPTAFNVGVGWTSASPAGTTLTGGFLGPLSVLQTNVPTAIMSQPFGSTVISTTTWETGLILSGARYWTGSIKYKFHFVSSPMQTGRVAFVPLYGVFTQPTTPIPLNTMLGYSYKIFDLSDVSNEFIVEVPYVSPYPRLKVCNGVSWQNVVGSVGANIELQKWFMGSWRLVVLNRLTFPSSCPDMTYVNVYASGGSDFKATGHFDHNATLLPLYGTVQSKNDPGEEDNLHVLEPQSGWDNLASISSACLGVGNPTEAINEESLAQSGRTELGASAAHSKEPIRQGMARGKRAPISRAPAAKDHDWTISDMMAKFNIVKTGTWTPTSARGIMLETLRFPTDFLLPLTSGSSTHAAVWNNFRFIRWKSAKITVMFNTNKFQVGALNAFYYATLDPAAALARCTNNFASQTTVPHTVMQASMGNPGELEIPWISGVEYINTEIYSPSYVTNPWQELGTFFLEVWNPLVVGAGQPAVIDYTIFIEFNGIEPHVPRVMPSFGDAQQELNNTKAQIVLPKMGDVEEAMIGRAFDELARRKSRRLVPQSDVGEEIENPVKLQEEASQPHGRIVDKFAAPLRQTNDHFNEHLVSFKDLIKRYAPFMNLSMPILNIVNDSSGSAIALKNAYTSSVAFPVGPPVEHVPSNYVVNYRGPLGAISLMYGCWRGSLKYMFLHRTDKLVSAQHQVMFNPVDNPNVGRFQHLGFDKRSVLNDTAVAIYVGDVMSADPSIYAVDNNASISAYSHTSRGTTNAVDYTDDGASWNWIEVPYWSQYKIMKNPSHASEGANPGAYFDHITPGEVVCHTIYRTGQTATNQVDDITCLVAAGDDFRFGVFFGAMNFTFRIFIDSFKPGAQQYCPALYDCWPTQPLQY